MTTLMKAELLLAGYEPCDPILGEQIVDGVWYCAKFGCDSLQATMDHLLATCDALEARIAELDAGWREAETRLAMAESRECLLAARVEMLREAGTLLGLHGGELAGAVLGHESTYRPRQAMDEAIEEWSRALNATDDEVRAWMEQRKGER